MLLWEITTLRVVTTGRSIEYQNPDIVTLRNLSPDQPDSIVLSHFLGGLNPRPGLRGIRASEDFGGEKPQGNPSNQMKNAEKNAAPLRLGCRNTGILGLGRSIPECFDNAASEPVYDLEARYGGGDSKAITGHSSVR